MDLSWSRVVMAIVSVLVVGACGDDTGEEGASDPDVVDTSTSSGGASIGRVMVTADWRAKTLSICDFDLLAAGAQTRDEILVATVDLSAYEPGPIEVELTPDATLAVVSVSPGFFDGLVGTTLGITDIPLQGTLLVVDIATAAVVAEVPTAHVPMGIAISPDGARAYTANFGIEGAVGSTITIVDLQTLTVVEDVDVGPRPEQISISTDGTLGIVSLDGDDAAVRVFQTADVAGTMSDRLPTAGDPSDVDFIAGTSLAVVANSLAPSNYAVLDVSDPSAPVIAFDSEAPGGIPYGATPIPGTTHFVMTIANDAIEYHRIDAASNPPSTVWESVIDGVRSFPLGIAVAADGGLAVSGALGANVLVVIDLDDGTARTIPWLAEPGPTYVAIAN
jgi:DNA-binding beta-propeller fold protein YncE